MNESIEDVANRVLAHAYVLQGKADSTYREWEHNPTFSNAIRRDDAADAALAFADMTALARAVLAQTATGRDHGR